MHVDQKFQMFGCTDKLPQLLCSVIGVAGSFILGVGYIAFLFVSFCFLFTCTPRFKYWSTIFMDHEYLKLSMNILLRDVTQNPQVLGTSLDI